jgi:hypothetical protein
MVNPGNRWTVRITRLLHAISAIHCNTITWWRHGSKYPNGQRWMAKTLWYHTHRSAQHIPWNYTPNTSVEFIWTLIKLPEDHDASGTSGSHAWNPTTNESIWSVTSTNMDCVSLLHDAAFPLPCNNSPTSDWPTCWHACYIVHVIWVRSTIFWCSIEL